MFCYCPEMLFKYFPVLRSRMCAVACAGPLARSLYLLRTITHVCVRTHTHARALSLTRTHTHHHTYTHTPSHAHTHPPPNILDTVVPTCLPAGVVRTYMGLGSKDEAVAAAPSWMRHASSQQHSGAPPDQTTATPAAHDACVAFAHVTYHSPMHATQKWE
jgi:hypothetical protein